MREKLANFAHEWWSNWMRYLFSKGAFNDDGSWTMPIASVQRWTRQMNTPYSELSEKEKDSDRREAEKIFECVKAAFAAQFGKKVKDLADDIGGL